MICLGQSIDVSGFQTSMAPKASLPQPSRRGNRVGRVILTDCGGKVASHSAGKGLVRRLWAHRKNNDTGQPRCYGTQKDANFHFVQEKFVAWKREETDEETHGKADAT